MLAASPLLADSGRLVAASPDSPDGDFAAVDDLVLRDMAASAIPGLSLGIARDGEVVHLAAFGVAGPDGRPMTTHTGVVIGSVGKSITALAVRQLVAAGRLDLEAPVSRYLPWFDVAAGASAAWDAITVRHLLTHTSGLSTAAGQDPHWYEPGLSPTDLAKSLTQVALAEPAGAYAYSNLNYVLLGVVVEAVSGQPYADYLRDHIFGPLGMDDSFAGAAPPHADRATGHRYLFGLTVPWDEPTPTAIIPAGYQVSTGADMARYVAALSDGGLLDGIDIVAPGRQASPGRAYGTDWRPIPSLDAGVASGQSGATLTTNADILVAPAQQLGVVVLMNANPTQVLGLPRGAAEIAHDVLRLVQGQPPAPAPPDVRSVYLVVDLLLLLLAVLLGVHVLRARGWRERLRRARHPRWLLARTTVEDVVLPIAILVTVPIAIGWTGSTRPGDVIAGWRFLLWTLPDIGAALLALAAVGLALGLVKVWRATRPTRAGVARG
jgi:CubicO group peptidase (beta-lactamase class C family)